MIWSAEVSCCLDAWHDCCCFRVFYLLCYARSEFSEPLKQLQMQGSSLLQLNLQDAKELLYRLYRAGFVSLQDIPRTADHAPSRNLYTWRVEIDAAANKLASELYKAALNVCLRLDFEYKRQKDVSF